MSALKAKTPRLESGDRLTRAEFHRRYLASPHIKKAELVEGVVYVPSPVTVRHGEPHGWAALWVGAYTAMHPGIHSLVDSTVLLDGDNEVQPDICLWQEAVGGPRLNSSGYLEGPPQLVVEIAVSSASYDLHDKLNAYRRAGVQEYIVWRVEEAAIDWLRLNEGVYTRVEPDADGVIESAVFPGLRLPIAKMLAGDLAGVLAEVQRSA